MRKTSLLLISSAILLCVGSALPQRSAIVSGPKAIASVSDPIVRGNGFRMVEKTAPIEEAKDADEAEDSEELEAENESVVFAVETSESSGSSASSESSAEVAYIQNRGVTDSNGKNLAIKPLNKRAIQRNAVPKLLAVVDQPDIKLKHRLIADEVLRALPLQCRDALHDLHVRYDDPKHRGLSGKHTIILDGGVPEDEFRALFIHELGHVIDLGCLKGTKTAGKTKFKDGGTVMYTDDPSVSFYRISWSKSKTKLNGWKKADFASGYAKSDVFEDFAEGLVYFALHRDSFRARAATNEKMAQKYEWYEQYFGPSFNIATDKSTWKGKVPWDITKLAYEWHPGIEIARNN